MTIHRRTIASPGGWGRCLAFSTLVHLALLLLFPGKWHRSPYLPRSIEVDLVSGVAPAVPVNRPETAKPPVEKSAAVPVPARVEPPHRDDAAPVSAAVQAPQPAAVPAGNPVPDAHPLPAQQPQGRGEAAQPAIAELPREMVASQAASSRTGAPQPPVADMREARKSYLQRCRYMIERRKEYPHFARKAGVEGTVTISVALAPDGALMSTRVLKSSGSPLLDSAALRSVQSITRFAPLPQDLAGEPFHFEVPITFRLAAQ